MLSHFPGPRSNRSAITIPFLDNDLTVSLTVSHCVSLIVCLSYCVSLTVSCVRMIIHHLPKASLLGLLKGE